VFQFDSHVGRTPRPVSQNIVMGGKMRVVWPALPRTLGTMNINIKYKSLNGFVENNKRIFSFSVRAALNCINIILLEWF